ncbi:MAG: YiiX/YebB-like N1pC/P60 family cysteine hydrolase [Patescibacteria group bacterium]
MVALSLSHQQERGRSRTVRVAVRKLENVVRDRGLTPLEKIHGRLPVLLTGDIVLIRKKKGGLARELLRRITNSYWDHTALIIFGKNQERGYSNNVIVESVQGSSSRPFYFGSEIHSLDKYMKEPDKYDIGIKRVTWLTRDLRHRIRAYALMNIDTPYYPLKTFRFLRAYLFEMTKKVVMSRQRYSCSALVQKAYYEAVNIEDRTKVLFGNRALTPMQLLDTTSPADIAKSPLSEWIYNEH